MSTIAERHIKFRSEALRPAKTMAKGNYEITVTIGVDASPGAAVGRLRVN